MGFYALALPKEQAHAIPAVLHSIEISLDSANRILFIEKLQNSEERIEAYVQVLSLYSHVDYRLINWHIIDTYKGDNLEHYIKELVLRVLSQKNGDELFRNWMEFIREREAQNEKIALSYATIAISAVIVTRCLLFFFK